MNIETNDPIRAAAAPASAPAATSPAAPRNPAPPPLRDGDLVAQLHAPSLGDESAEPTGRELLRAALAAIQPAGAAGKVSEEDLFAAVAYERVARIGGADAAAAFLASLRDQAAALRRGDGYVPVEKAVLHTLRTLAEDRVLAAGQADAVYSQAFAAAQLDGNAKALFDGRGGAGDATVAVAGRGQALTAALAALGRFDAGDLPEARSLDRARPTGAGRAAGRDLDGFLWKPESDADGKLVVLAPPSLTGTIGAVRLVTADGQLLEEGDFRGVANGDRAHFRFAKPGGAYPRGVVVELVLDNGEVRRVPIADPSRRVE